MASVSSCGTPRAEPWTGTRPARPWSSSWAVRLPLAQLRYWMLGVPAPVGGGLGSSPVQMATGPVPGFVQDGWVVTLDESRVVGAWRLPVKLSATTSGVRIKLVVDDWQLPP